MTFLSNEFNLLNFWIKASYTYILLRDFIEDLKQKIELFTFIFYTLKKFINLTK